MEDTNKTDELPANDDLKDFKEKFLKIVKICDDFGDRDEKEMIYDILAIIRE